MNYYLESIENRKKKDEHVKWVAIEMKTLYAKCQEQFGEEFSNVESAVRRLFNHYGEDLENVIKVDRIHLCKLAEKVVWIEKRKEWESIDELIEGLKQKEGYRVLNQMEQVVPIEEFIQLLESCQEEKWLTYPIG